MRHSTDCRRCALLSKTRKYIVWGEGPAPCDIMLVGEAPGKMEDRFGRPFVESAPAGGELTSLLYRNGIQRGQIYITNIIKCHPPDDRDPEPDEIINCEIWLEADIEAASPRYILTVGAFATRRFLGPDATMEMVHGIPHTANVNGKPTVILPCYHPAAGLHASSTMILVHDDFRAAAEVIKGRRQASHIADAFPSTNYIAEDDPERVRHDMESAESAGFLGLDTESAGGRVWSIQYSFLPGEGVFVRADNEDCVREIARGVQSPSLVVGIANALYDLPILQPLGIIPANPVDTMLMAYLLGNEPKGLKPLAYRHCGMKMQDYEDVVSAATHVRAMRYLAAAVEMEWPDPDPVLEIRPDGKAHIKRPQNIARKIARILADSSKDDDPANPVKRWAQIKPDEGRGMVEEKLGEMPMGELTDIPFEAALYYACRDADAVVRVYPILWRKLIENGLVDVFNMDMKAMALVSDMMVAGIKGRREKFEELSAYLKSMAESVLHDLLMHLRKCGYKWDYINPGSWRQVARLLYGKDYFNLGKYMRGMKGEGSTDNEMLSRLLEMRSKIGEGAARTIELIKDYRGYVKLKGTYADPMPGFMREDGRIHANFRTTNTTTGRLSASSPNLMAFPVRSADGRKLRGCFEAANGCVLLSVDYSQIELRILAHCSEDPVMMDIFRSGVDLHAKTASEIFGIPVDQLDDLQHRRPSKCFHPDTEVLTPSGWKKMKRVVEEDAICQAWPEQGTGRIRLDWTRDFSLGFKPNWNKCLVHLRSGGIDIRVTPDHRMLVGNKDEKTMSVVTPYDMSKAQCWWNSGYLKGDLDADIDTLRLAVAAQAHGWYSCGRVVFEFTEESKIQRMEELLESGSFPYSRSARPDGTTFTIGVEGSDKIKKMLDADKTLPWWWLQLRPELRRIVLEEAAKWNRYSSQDREVLQALAAVTGYKTRQVGDNVAIVNNSKSRGGNVSIVEIEYSGDVAMLSVPSTFVLVRDGGVPLICGQTINFGVVYGMGAEGLQGALATMGLQWDLERCDRLIKEWFKLYSGVKRYMDAIHDHAKRYGYVVDMFGRRRWVPNAQSRNKRLQAEALREGGNHPIQAGAQGVIKTAMGKLRPVCQSFKTHGVVWNVLLQIHDDLVSEVSEEWVKTVCGIKVDVMERAVKLRVPVKVDPKVGKNWGEMEKMRD